MVDDDQSKTWWLCCVFIYALQKITTIENKNVYILLTDLKKKGKIDVCDKK